MDRKKFIEQVRSGTASFRVDEVKVSFPRVELSGSGKLELEGDRFHLELRLPDGTVPPNMRGGIITRDDFGSVEGLIEHDLAFQIKNFPPHHQHSSHNGRSTLRYHLDAIELSPMGSDAQTYDQIRDELELLESSGLREHRHAPTKESQPEEASDVMFSGLLRGFKLISRNASTRSEEHNDFLGTKSSVSYNTQCGGLAPEWEYGLIERGEDVEFHLRLKSDCKSLNAQNDLAILHAFLDAVAFMHGQHAWPFTLEFRRDSKLITDRVRPPKISTRSPHQPFNERIWFNARAGNVQWDFESALQKAYAFFRAESAVTAEVKQLLFLCREAAGAAVHGTITNIALCSLLDSAVNLVFEHRIEGKSHKVETTFNEVRTRILALIVKNAANARDTAEEAWRRFQAIVTNSEFHSAREKFRAVAEHIGFKWDGDWEEIYRFWAKWRPRLSHRGTKSDDDAESIAAHFNIESRVVGAIHMLVLKLMGYEGVMVSSTFEDKVRRI